MSPEEQQIVLAAAGYYTGGIDGKLGSQSKKAYDQVVRDLGHTYTFKPSVWRGAIGGHLNKRKRTAAIQACLNKLGYEAGKADGWDGHNTRNALDALMYKLATGKHEVIVKTPIAHRIAGSSPIPSQSQVPKYYGNPNQIEASRLTTIKLPFKMRIDYNLRQSTNKMTVHKLAAPSLEAAMLATHAHYGLDGMRRLGIDRYAGGFNKRKMRGGSKWSMHAYGCAVDFYAAPNGLRAKCPDALFCGKDYARFLDIMQDHEWLPAIRLWGADAMHFQRATL